MRKIFGFFAPCIWCLTTALQVWANDPSETAVDPEQVILADGLHICSEINELKADTIQSFAEHQFGDTAKPEIMDGISNSSIGDTGQVLFIAVGTDGTASDQLKSCLSDFHALREDITEAALQEGRTVGTHQINEGTRLPDIYAPIQTSWTYERKKGWLIIYFSSLKKGSEATTDALIGLFDLPRSTCVDNPNCPSDPSHKHQ